MPDPYLQAFSDFIQDSTRSGHFCIGPESYERATLFCMQMLAYYKRRNTLPVDVSDGILGGSQDRNCDHCNNTDRTSSGQWRTKSISSYPDTEKSHLLVGYIVFFLPLCGRSKALIQRCQHPDTFLDVIKHTCPDRHELAYKQSQEYLQRTKLPQLPILSRTWNWFTSICSDEEPLEPEMSDEYIY